ncbi:aspartyl/glutamyl-tRNA(Asn/Gln) amidotransferase subunit C [Dissulfurispira thermophila]|uniref:Aspartyl/glutamyl-tRNA(Asn/Gln) amidotransferase subunit C n=2 Tax=root TaxID=1 RepID=A0A7G1GZ90_9BACT|nr:Asp-tRNA(Asn)/Glu-tRNA(Gln) amidotransferase subunit GatC [Dissulfurispira thermophila]BCB95810.1 aspartyl/glutamyl-tRNA(Asn/Gln) amidotransferase subunit C [Dissulfurispira thermophila]
MKITTEDVKHIARLSRLYLSDDEIETFSGQLSSIIEYVEQLNSLDTDNIEPTSHVIPLNNVMRDDIPSVSLSVGDAIKNAPDSTEKFYRVPKIIE